nr:tryptophan synthase alpha chain [uncultured bacterium]
MRRIALASCLLAAACGSKPPMTMTMQSPPDLAMFAFPDCTDGIANEGESDVDCGGPCKKCKVMQKCNGAGDCQSGICLMGTCMASSICSDGMRDGDETDVDCGGSCAACGFGAGCTQPGDCKSSSCTAGQCAALMPMLGDWRNVNVGKQPLSAAVGDFDGDRLPDVAALSGAEDKLSVAISMGSLRFADPVGVKCPAATTTDVLAAGDLDGDGKADLIAISGTMVWTLISQGMPGMPAFAAPKQIGQAGLAPASPRLADLDRDGRLDLVLVDGNFDNAANGYNVFVVINMGGGQWQSPRKMFVGADAPVTPSVVDVNGDHILDIVVLTGDNASTALGKGDGSFAAWQHSMIGNNASMDRSAIGDLDGDGHPDVIGLATRGALSVMAGGGNGVFAHATPIAMPNSPVDHVVFDVDIDGKADAITLDHVGEAVTLFLGQDNRMVKTAQTRYTGPSPASLSTADVNLDGLTDVIIACPDSDLVSIILNRSF